MAVRFYSATLPLVVKVQCIILDTSEALKEFIDQAFFEHVKDDTEEGDDNENPGSLYVHDDLRELDTYLNNIFEDVSSREDAVYALTYRAYEMMGLGDRVSDAYEKFARYVLQQLIMTGAYGGDILQYRMTRLLGNDIVLVLSSRSEEYDDEQNDLRRATPVSDPVWAAVHRSLVDDKFRF